MADSRGEVPSGATADPGDTPGVEGDFGGGRQRQWVLTGVAQVLVEDVGEGWSSLHQGVM